MSLLDKIKSMLISEDGAAEKLIKEATSTADMLDHLDELITKNEVELRRTRQELARLELSERASIENIKSGRIGDREKEFVLLQIKRTRTQMGNLTLKADILNKNIELHMNLVGKIQAMEAMDLRGIEQNVVERVMLDFEEGMENFRESVETGEGVTETREDVLTAKDKEDLRKLEKEILGENKIHKQRENDDATLREIEEELALRANDSKNDAALELQADNANRDNNAGGKEEPEPLVE